MKIKKLLIASITAALVSAKIHAVEGLQYLRLPVFAESEGMAGAYTGIAIGPPAIFYNPAGLAFDERREYHLGTGYVDWLEGTSKETIYVIFPTHLYSKYFIQAASLDIFSAGSMTRYDASGNEAGKLEYTDTAFNILLGGKRYDTAAWGGTFKILKESIANYSGSGYAFDLGGLYAFSDLLRAGVSYSNIGTFSLDSIDVDLARTLRMGVGFTVPDRLFLLGIDWEKTADDAYFHLGGQLAHRGYIFRAGWKDTGMGGEFTAGLGVSTQHIDSSEWGGQIFVNYSYMSGGVFKKSLHRFDVGVKF